MWWNKPALVPPTCVEAEVGIPMFFHNPKSSMVVTLLSWERSSCLFQQLCYVKLHHESSYWPNSAVKCMCVFMCLCVSVCLDEHGKMLSSCSANALHSSIFPPCTIISKNQACDRWGRVWELSSLILSQRPVLRYAIGVFPVACVFILCLCLLMPVISVS